MNSIEKIFYDLHSDIAWSVEHIPNTDYIVTGSSDNTLKIWNYKT